MLPHGSGASNGKRAFTWCHRFWTPRPSILTWCSRGLAIIAGLLLAGHVLASFSWAPSRPCRFSTKRSRTLCTKIFALQLLGSIYGWQHQILELKGRLWDNHMDLLVANMINVLYLLAVSNQLHKFVTGMAMACRDGSSGQDGG